MESTTPLGKGMFARRWWLRSHATDLPQHEKPTRKAKAVPQHENPTRKAKAVAAIRYRSENALTAGRYRLRKLPRLAPRYFWLCRYDFGFLLLVNAITGILLLWAPIYRRSERKFPLWWDPDLDVWYGPTWISQPRLAHETISSLITAIVCVAIPLLCLILVQLFVRDFWDSHSAKVSFLKAIALM